MATFIFQLATSKPGGTIKLRELNGHDQLIVNDTGTATVLVLLNNLIVKEQAIKPLVDIPAEKISVSDRDLLLAEVYQHNFGNRIESTMTCTACIELYRVNFLLNDLVSHARQHQSGPQADEDGFYPGANDTWFRLPNGEDELIALAVPPAQSTATILKRCLKDPQTSNTELPELMEKLGPLLITDVKVSCPECGTAQTVQFDVQSYLLTRILNERKTLIAEIHSIASAYNWSHKEILDLPVTERRAYYKLINQI